MSSLLSTPESHGATYPLYEYCSRITTIVSTRTRYGRSRESLFLTWSPPCGAKAYDCSERIQYLLMRTSESNLNYPRYERLQESEAKHSP